MSSIIAVRPTHLLTEIHNGGAIQLFAIHDGTDDPRNCWQPLKLPVLCTAEGRQYMVDCFGANPNSFVRDLSWCRMQEECLADFEGWLKDQFYQTGEDAMVCTSDPLTPLERYAYEHVELRLDVGSVVSMNHSPHQFNYRCLDGTFEICRRWSMHMSGNEHSNFVHNNTKVRMLAQGDLAQNGSVYDRRQYWY